MDPMNKTNIQVAVRIRPVVENSTSIHHQNEKYEPIVVQRQGDTTVQLRERKLNEPSRSHTFNFDFIFDRDSTQLDVYEESVVELVDNSIMFGNNATVLAYGQTGSGKTHTMLGETKMNPLANDLLTPHSGMFLRVLADLIEYRERREKDLHFVIGLSCVEIYNDKIRDLLGGKPNEAPPPLQARMMADDVLLPGLIIKEVESLQSVFGEIQLAIARRRSRSTDSNATSSRSHCLFMLDILQCSTQCEKPNLDILQSGQQYKAPKNSGTASGSSSESSPVAPTPAAGGVDLKEWKGTLFKSQEMGVSEPVRYSRILIADLAGSEKIKNSGVSGEGMAEATAINSSLTALGNVVHAKYNNEIPVYRSSNLTRLLKTSFQPASSRVLLLAQVSPTQATYDESIGTCHFANKVKRMKVTVDPTVETDKTPFEYLEAARLLADLQADYHIFAAEHEVARGSLVKRLSASAQARSMKDGMEIRGDPKSEANNPKNGKIRADQLAQRGAISEATKLRDAFVVWNKEETEKELRQIQSMKKAAIDKVVEEHKRQFKEIERHMQKLAKEKAAHPTELLKIQQTVARERIRTEEGVAATIIKRGFFQAATPTATRLQQKSDTEWSALRQVPFPALTSLREAIKGQEQDDQEYVKLTAWHCNGRRLTNRLMEARSAKVSYLAVRQAVLALERWVDTSPNIFKLSIPETTNRRLSRAGGSSLAGSGVGSGDGLSRSTVPPSSGGSAFTSSYAGGSGVRAGSSDSEDMSRKYSLAQGGPSSATIGTGGSAASSAMGGVGGSRYNSSMGVTPVSHTMPTHHDPYTINAQDAAQHNKRAGGGSSYSSNVSSHPPLAASTTGSRTTHTTTTTTSSYNSNGSSSNGGGGGGGRTTEDF